MNAAQTILCALILSRCDLSAGAPLGPRSAQPDAATLSSSGVNDFAGLADTGHTARLSATANDGPVSIRQGRLQLLQTYLQSSSAGGRVQGQKPVTIADVAFVLPVAIFVFLALCCIFYLFVAEDDDDNFETSKNYDCNDAVYMPAQASDPDVPATMETTQMPIQQAMPLQQPMPIQQPIPVQQPMAVQQPRAFQQQMPIQQQSFMQAAARPPGASMIMAPQQYQQNVFPPTAYPREPVSILNNQPPSIPTLVTQNTAAQSMVRPPTPFGMPVPQTSSMVIQQQQQQQQQVFAQPTGIGHVARSPQIIMPRLLDGDKVGLTFSDDLLVKQLADTRAAQYGWSPGDRVLKVNGVSVSSKKTFVVALDRARQTNLSTGQPVVFDVEHNAAASVNRSKQLQIVVPRLLEGGSIGLTLSEDLLIAGFSDPRAAQMGWARGDKMLKVNGVPVFTEQEFKVELDKGKEWHRRGGHPIVFEVLRDMQTESTASTEDDDDEP